MRAATTNHTAEAKSIGVTDSELVLLSRLLQSMVPRAALLDDCGRIVVVNDHWQQFLQGDGLLAPGLSDNYVEIFERAQGFSSSEQHDIAAAIRSVLARQQASAELEYRCLAASQPRWFRMSCTEFSTENWRGALVLHTDITSLVQSEHSVTESEMRFRAIFERNSLPMWVFDPSTLRFLAVNEAAVEHYGYSREEFLGMTIADIRPNPDLALLRSKIADLDVTRVHVGVWRHLKKNGQLIRVEARWLWLPWIGGRACLVTVLDITERLATAEALAESEQRFRDMTESIGAVFWFVDRDANHLEYVSPAYEEIWGRPTSELYADPKQWIQNVHPDDRESVLRAMATSDSGGYQLECRIVRPDGSVRWIADRGFPVAAAEGRPRRMAGFSRDITERKTTDEHLRQAQHMQALGALTGGVAHDFNNLLTVIQGNAELLADQLISQPPQHRLAEQIEYAAERSAELTRRLLAFARQQVLEPKPVQLNTLIRDMELLLQRALGEHIEIELRYGKDLWITMVDAGQIENAVINLAINARDAMSAGGRIVIETENLRLDAAQIVKLDIQQPGDYVRLSVTDSGAGISEEHQRRVFEPFFSTKAQGKGSGLGLAMVYGFVKQSRGHIALESEVGRGTTIHIYLPRRAVEPLESLQTGRRLTAVGQTLAAAQGKRVLLVEDDEMVRSYAHHQLIDLGYDVIEASSGPEALEHLRQHPDIDLLFTDVIMPGGMSGPVLAEAARALQPELPVLFTSGYTADAIGGNGELDSSVLLLAKPYRREELERKLRQALDGVAPALHGTRA